MITVRGLVGELNGKILGFGGVAHNPDGLPVAFFDMKDEARPYKKAIVQGARELLKLIDTLAPGLPIAATANSNEKNAPRFLARLGFVRIGDEGYILKR